MNSCLYECSVMHHRFTPKAHHFSHGIFMFFLDLDELDLVAKKSTCSVTTGKTSTASAMPTMSPPRQSAQGTHHRFHPAAGHRPRPASRVMLLTLPRMLGYIFNPISIYYCFDNAGKPVCSVAEVGNTFREMKLYLLRREDLSAGTTFARIMPKNFYVSPFRRSI